MISVKCLNLLVLYSVLTEIIATENSLSFPKFARTSNCSLENEEYPLLFTPCNDTLFINDNKYWDWGYIYPNKNSDVLDTKDTVIKSSDFETYSAPTTYTTHRILIPIGLILGVIGAVCRRCCKSGNKTDEEPLCSDDPEGNFVYVTENVIPLPPPPTRQDGQKPSTDNGNGTEPPPPAYSDAVILLPLPTYEEITEKRNNSTKI